MWLIPFLIIGAIAIASASSARRSCYQLQLAPPPPPGPIAVLGQHLRAGVSPPPPVILCAIAEAEAIGRSDLASDIVRTFVAPVVYQHAVAQGLIKPVIDVPVTPAAVTSSCAVVPSSTDLSDAAIMQALNANPESFIERARSKVGADMVEMPHAAIATATMQATHAPIDGVSLEAWQHFVAKLERESPRFAAARHVGMFRQRVDRLRELGIDPKGLIGSPPAQRAALDRDLTDAYHHALESGMVEENVNRLIAVPGDHGEPQPVTRSGLLGVIQAAGLEGAVSWFEQPSDRQRFPHTTEMFLRTNGVF